jgi:glycosyltransferase involved in cell wall biosynthesis
MKILMLNNEYPPLGGGQASANKSIMDVLQSKYHTHSVDLITSSVNEFRRENTSIGEIFYLNIGKRNKNYHYQNVKDLMYFSLKSLFFARKLVRKNTYDMLIAWAGVPSGFVAYLLKKCFRIPYVVLLRGPDVPFHEAKWKILDKLIFRHLSPVIWRNAFKVIANSEELKNLAHKSSTNQRISIIENGVDFNFWKNDFKRQLPDFERIVLISVGRISKIKGFDLVIRAISELKIENIEYWIVGDGPEKNNLQILAQKLHCDNKVKFVGIKNKNELRELLHQSTLFCLPSYNEGMSNALIEAMACGLPVVVTDVGGTYELVKENGIIVEKGNSNAIAEAINKIISDNHNYKQMSNKAVEISKEMSWEIKTAKLLNQINAYD